MGALRTGEFDLGIGETHRFNVELQSGSPLRLRVDQQYVDVEVRVVDGETRDGLAVYDLPVERAGPEPVCFVAPKSSEYFIDISPFSGAGRYSLQTEAETANRASGQDRLCAEAHGLFQQAGSIGVDDPAAAAERYENAGDTANKADEPILSIVAYREAGSLWLRVGRPGRAIRAFEMALDASQASPERFLETSLLNRSGLAYRDLGDLALAQAAFEEAKRIAEAEGDPWAIASALTNLGRLATDLGAPHSALEYTDRALDHWRLSEKALEIAQALINRGTTLGTLERHDEAEDDLFEALRSAEAAGHRVVQGAALQAIGWNRYLAGNPEQGLEPVQAALDLFEDLGSRNRAIAALDRLGTLKTASGDAKGAEIAYREALARLAGTDNPKDVATVSANLGCLLGSRRYSAESDDLLRRARAYFRTAGDPKALAHVEFCRARLARWRGNSKAASERIEAALAIVDELRDRARMQGYIYLPIWLWQEYADLAVDIYLDAYRNRESDDDLARAFEVFDRARAWTLFEQVVKRKAQAGSGESAESPHPSVQPLALRLNLLAETRRRLGDSAGDGARILEIEKELRRLGALIEQQRAAERKRERWAGRLASPQPVTMPQILGYLPTDTALLAYRLGVEQSNLFVLTHDRARVFPLTNREQIEPEAESFYRSLEGSLRSGLQWKLMSEALARRLLPRDALPPEIRRLMIVPDGFLHYIPFAALAAPRTGYEVGATTSLLGDHFEISYVPSASLLIALDQRRLERAPSPTTAVIFADPVYQPDDERRSERQSSTDLDPSRPAEASPHTRGIAIRQMPEGPLPRLIYSADEAAVLERLLPLSRRQIRTGFDATKEAVLGSDLSRARILHFATHAWVDEGLPELSGVVLSQYDQTGRELDSRLYLHEIRELTLNADLTVLSGCQTALGKHVRGNGLLGLTHGFFEAGATEILVTLWSVDDQAASILMEAFYEGLLDRGLTATEALKEAQDRLRRRPGFEAPYYWAPFVLHGVH